MGALEDVQQMLSQSFPGIQFAIDAGGGWTGTFDVLEKDGFAVHFYFDPSETVSKIEICMYGQIQPGIPTGLSIFISPALLLVLPRWRHIRHHLSDFIKAGFVFVTAKIAGRFDEFLSLLR